MDQLKTIELSAKILHLLFGWKCYKIDDSFVLNPSDKHNLGYKLHDSYSLINETIFEEINIAKLHVGYIKTENVNNRNFLFLARLPNFAEDKNLFNHIIEYFKEINKIKEFKHLIESRYSAVDFYALNQYDTCLLVIEFFNKIKGECLEVACHNQQQGSVN